MGQRLRQLLLYMPQDAELRRVAIDNQMTWDFGRGYAPRSFTGNWRTPEDVRLVLVMGEPSTPYADERYSEQPEEWFKEAVLDQPHAPILRSTRPHNSRGVWFLSECGFDPSDAENTWRQVAHFNSLWLTIPNPLGRAPRAVTDYFGRTYLGPLLEFFPHATIVAAGKKAADRVRATGTDFTEMGALSPPGCHRKSVVAAQEEIARSIRASLGSQHRKSRTC